MKRVTKLVSIIIAILLMSIAMFGCATKPEEDITATTSKEETTTTKEETTKDEDNMQSQGYPLDTDVTLTYWCDLPGTLMEAGITSMNDIPFFKGNDSPYAKGLLERTGVNIEIMHPPTGQELQDLNLMIASGTLPDMIYYHWTSKFPGGPMEAMQLGVIEPLNDLVNQYAPDYKKMMDAFPEYEKGLKADNGDVYAFQPIFDLSKGEGTNVATGIIVRKDWLDELNLEAPETIDEWETVLASFVDNKTEGPLVISNWAIQRGFFASAWGERADYYDQDGTVVYGPLEPGYKEFIVRMKEWYEKGYINKEIATIDNATLSSYILTGKVGVFIAGLGGGISKYTSAALDAGDTTFELMGAKNAVINKGDKPKHGIYNSLTSGSGVAISAQCDEKEIAAQFLNYLYTDEGSLFRTYSEEGVLFDVDSENNKVEPTDFYNNPEGFTQRQIHDMYTGVRISGLGHPSGSYRTFIYPQMYQALEQWRQTDGYKHNLPRTLMPTTEESSDIAKYQADIKTYVTEMTLKYIMGVEPLEEYDSTFIPHLEKLGVHKALEIKQNMLDRYYNR